MVCRDKGKAVYSPLERSSNVKNEILVIGATGKLGSQVVNCLEQLGGEIRGATRNPENPRLRSRSTARFVEFDFERPETFPAALKGIERVFLIARPGDDHSDRVAVPLIEEMKRQSIRHVVDVTAMGVETRDDIALRKMEILLEESGIEFTHLRPNWFMQVFSDGPLLKDMVMTNALHLPTADAKISYVDVRDIAAMAATALTKPGHVNKAYTLTGAEALDHERITAKISKASGRMVTYVPIDDEAARQAILAAGLSMERAERLIGFYRLVRQGFCARVSGDIETILGRPPISFTQFAQDFASCWK